MEFKRSLYNVIFLVFVGLGLTYIFLGTDIIPDSVGLVLPGMILGFMDDIVVVLGLVFFLAKIKQWLIGTKAGSGGYGFWGWVVTFAVIAGVLVYVFLPVDLIPDSIPWVGFMDDAAAAIMGMVAVRKFRRKVK